MSSNIKVLQVIPKLGYGGAETGCYDIAHYLPENNCKSFIVTSGGELTKFIDKKKVKLIRLPVHSKNPILILLNTIILIGIILFYNITIVHARSRAPAWSCLLASKVTCLGFGLGAWLLSLFCCLDGSSHLYLVLSLVQRLALL